MTSEQKPRLTPVTERPINRLLTIIALVAAGFAVLATLAMVVAAMSGRPSLVAGAMFTWIFSLLVVFAITRHLKAERDALREIAEQQ